MSTAIPSPAPRTREWERTTTARILIVEDDPDVLSGLVASFNDEGWECSGVATFPAAKTLIEQTAFDVIFTDIRLPETSGIEVLRRVRELRPESLVILMTAYGSYESARDALRLGAFDYLEKPFPVEEAVLKVRRIIEHRERLADLQWLKRDVLRTYDFEHIIGSSARMHQILDLIKKISSTTSTVLITGESGTGKELVARAVHFNSPMTRDRRFIAVNCAAIPETLLESELFGHAKGSFTGAVADKQGLFEAADGGSIFLDEIGEMSLPLQAKLLRVIETKQVVRVGGTTPTRANVRIICSTNRDLKKMVGESTFRHDLYYRIDVVQVELPPLRDRRDDIPDLVQHFMQKYNRELNLNYQEVDPAAMDALRRYEWRGNVRELENIIERAMILGDNKAVRLADLPPNISKMAEGPDPDDLREALSAFERRHLMSMLERLGGDKEEAAKRLGIGLSSLYRKIKQLERRKAPRPSSS